MLDISTFPPISVDTLQDGDILVQMPDPNILFGKAVLAFDTKDAAAKGVPVAMHVLMRTTYKGQPHRLEAWFHCREVPFFLDSGTYVVLRPSWTAAQRDKGIAWGRTQIRWFGPVGRLYGFSNLLRLAYNMFMPRWARVPGQESSDPVCSQYAGEILEHGEYPLTADDTDAELTPSDYLTPTILSKCPVVGRIEVL